MLLLTCVLSLVVSAAQGHDALTSVRAYVFTETSSNAPPSPDEQGRVEAVKEVLGREQRDEPSGAFGGKQITPMGDTIIRLHLTSGKDESDLKGMGQGTWSRAAKDAADRILKWIARREPTREKK